MRLLLTGASGQLGLPAARAARRRAGGDGLEQRTGGRTVGRTAPARRPGRPGRGGPRLRAARPDVVLHAAALAARAAHRDPGHAAPRSTRPACSRWPPPPSRWCWSRRDLVFDGEHAVPRGRPARAAVGLRPQQGRGGGGGAGQPRRPSPASACSSALPWPAGRTSSRSWWPPCGPGRRVTLFADESRHPVPRHRGGAGRRALRLHRAPAPGRPRRPQAGSRWGGLARLLGADPSAIVASRHGPARRPQAPGRSQHLARLFPLARAVPRAALAGLGGGPPGPGHRAVARGRGGRGGGGGPQPRGDMGQPGACPGWPCGKAAASL